MGDVFVFKEDHNQVINAALFVQSTSGVPISATFNNTKVPPTQENLDLWLDNFQPLYDVGVRSATIPHTHWVATGQIQKRYPELKIKNTILRDVRTASEIVALGRAGFHYINLDRDLMRDKDTLLRIKQAKEFLAAEGLPVEISLLANEGCLGNCPMMVEHFEYNNDRTKDTPQYFNSAISRVSCPKWDKLDPAVPLKTANLPPWREDWDEFVDELGINTFKMHGRENADKLWESMEIIERYATGEEILFSTFDDYINDTNLVEKPINAWRKIIKNCKFDCWECKFCDNIYQKKSGEQFDPKIKQVIDAIDNSAFSTYSNDVPGLTSNRVKTLLNELGKISTTYLEVGTHIGSTLTSTIDSNTLTVYAVDNWKDNVQPLRDDVVIPENTKETFISNAKRFKGNNNIKVFDSDLFNANRDEMTNVDLFFYDGPHDRLSTRRAVQYYAKSLADTAILVFDDANWQGVVDGAKDGIKVSDLNVIYEKILLNEQENDKQWWNGVYIVIVKK
jgi:Asp-tRNA(Asn)/Glu-tRNA(Gln) amidotransferase C subunit